MNIIRRIRFHRLWTTVIKLNRVKENLEYNQVLYSTFSNPKYLQSIRTCKNALYYFEEQYQSRLEAYLK